MNSKDKAVYIANLACGKKAEGIVILDIKKLSSIADYIIICTGTSDRHVQAIADSIEHELKKKRIIPLSIEGVKEGRWALIDCGDIIVHIFYEPVRDFYNLEGLWSDAPRLKM